MSWCGNVISKLSFLANARSLGFWSALASGTSKHKATAFQRGSEMMSANSSSVGNVVLAFWSNPAR